MSSRRWVLGTFLVAVSLLCGLSIFLHAANPTSGSISLSSGPVSWTGTAAGGAYNGESTCVEMVNCDTFTLTVLGTPADWSGKRVQVAMSWVVLANDYDIYIHKGDNSGPVVDQAAHGAPSTSETAYIEAGDLDASGSTTFTVHVGYFTGEIADEYHCLATVVPAFPPPPPAPPRSQNWTINYHGECCEGNLAAAGNNTFVLLPVLVQGNKILKSADGGKTWTQKYPPAPASVPFGIEGDMQAFGTDVIFFGTELAVMVTAHSNDFGETFVPVQNPVASAGNDQAWSYLGPFGDMRPGGPLPTDEPYVLAGWMRIGASVVFSFDGGLTYPIQTPLVGDDGSGPDHVVCRNNAHAPNNAPDSRVPNALFAKHKAGRHGTWGTDRAFYWTEPADGTNPGDRDLYVCKTSDFGVNWTGIKHPMPLGPASDFVVSHSAFDNKGTFYVMHGDKLYVSFNGGESFAFVHTLPRYGSARRSDAGSDQSFVVDCGTIHIGLLEDAANGNGRVYYLRGKNVDTANPTWDEELVDEVGSVRLDFLYIVLDGNGIPTISYTTPDKEVTTASRNSAPFSVGPCGNTTPLTAVSRKVHGTAGPFDVNLLGLSTGIEPRTGGPSGNHEIVITFPTAITIGSISSSCGSIARITTAGTETTIELTGVANATRCSIDLHGVSDGPTTNDVSIPVGFLVGDTTANGLTNSSDISQTQSQSGQPVTRSNFREDVTVNGLINSSDISVVQSASGTGLPPAAPSTTSNTGASQPAAPAQSKPRKQSRPRSPRNS
jgi:hypothetical protein